MAIYHLHTHTIGRGSVGRSVVACAAYRAGEKLHDPDDLKQLSATELAAYRSGEVVYEPGGKAHDYTRKGGVEHTEIILPEGVDAAWARDRQMLWSMVDATETRKNSRLAREWRIAFPHELDFEQRLALARDFATEVAERYQVAADVALHEPSRSGDQRNYHAHVLCTTRQITNEGFAGKTEIEWSNTNLKKAGLPYGSIQIREMRMVWEELANEHLMRAGIDARIDCRTLAEQGIELEPREPVATWQFHAAQREAFLGTTSLILPLPVLDAERSAMNAAAIEARPEMILDRLAQSQSTFTRHDVARAVHRFVNEDWARFDETLNIVMASPSLVCLMEGGRADTGIEIEAVWSTRDVALREATMLERAERMSLPRSVDAARPVPEGTKIGLDAEVLERAIATVEKDGDRPFRLSDEQQVAVRVLGGDECLAVLRGVAGTGKTTALSALREAAESEDRRIVGASLAGKAARELEDGSGIASRTLASWERSWSSGYDTLGPGDILVVDEAGMVGSAQMARVLEAVETAGAKAVLVGDERQLQPIEAGAAFRNIKDRLEVGHGEARNPHRASPPPVTELSEVRRQSSEWERMASEAFGRGNAALALDLYHEHGQVRLHAGTAETHAAIVADYFARLDQARAASPDGVQGLDHIVTAYRNDDVAALNAAIRDERVARGELGKGASFRTDDGTRTFAVGDRVLLTRNDRELGVANGDRGEVVRAVEDRLDVRLGDGRIVQLDAPGGRKEEERLDPFTSNARDALNAPPTAEPSRPERDAGYGGVRHAYAVTTHRAQGMTVDRVHVMAGQGMHASLAYVAMTRQREGATLHASQDHFRSYEALRDAISRERVSHGVGDYLRPGNALAALQERMDDTKRVQAKEAAYRPVEREPLPERFQLRQSVDRAVPDRFASFSPSETIIASPPSPEAKSSTFAGLNLSVPLEAAKPSVPTARNELSFEQRIALGVHIQAVAELKIAEANGKVFPFHGDAVNQARSELVTALGKDRVADLNEAIARNPKLFVEFERVGQMSGQKVEATLDKLTEKLGRAVEHEGDVRTTPALQEQRVKQEMAERQRQELKLKQEQKIEISRGPSLGR